MDFQDESGISQALRLVGEILAAEGFEYAVTILGGAALNLLGIVERTTSDVDILAFAVPNHGRALTKARSRNRLGPCRSPCFGRRRRLPLILVSTRIG